MSVTDEFDLGEKANYIDNVMELLKDPKFRSVIAYWAIDSRRPSVRPVQPEELAIFNFRLGYAKLMEDFMASLEQVAPNRFMEITQEVIDYGTRRRDAERAERDSGNDGLDEY